MKEIVVIGAGIGGLAAAARLSKKGYRVTIFEKNSQPGGRVGLIDEQGYRFDTGPTLFLMPDTFAHTYQDLGERMEDHLELIRLDPTYRVHFQDGSWLDLTGDLVQMREQLERIEPGSFEAYLNFLSEGYRHYQLSLNHFVGRNFDGWSDYFSLSNLPLLFKLKALAKHHANTARFFRDPRLQAAFSFQNMYLGLSPFDAPATYSLLQYTELAEGIWFPRGGMYQVIRSLTEIAKGLGVKFQYNAQVERILIGEDQAKGIVLENGEAIKADIVIANADLPYVYAELLPKESYTAKLERKKYTSSALMFFWGLKDYRAAELLHHNVFLADQEFRISFDKIFKELTLPNEPSFYINAPARTDETFAPSGGDTLMVLVPTGHIDKNNDQDLSVLEERAKDAVLARLEKLGIQDLQNHIDFQASWGPHYYKDTLNLAKGAAFGLSHNFTQIGYLRPHNQHPKYHNLYFVGASTHPGTGLPIVLISARLVVDRLLQDQGIPVDTSPRIRPSIAEQAA